MLWQLLLALLPALCQTGPLVASPGGRLAALLSSRQVAPSQQILGELQHLFRQAASGQHPSAYGAARDQLDQLVSGLDLLASGVPLAHEEGASELDSAASGLTTRRTVNMPIIDPGLFVIQGVNSCGGGAGYCMLGSNCSLDMDFMPDGTGNCNGLLTAFTPAANFSCCKFNSASRLTATPRPTPTTTEGTTFDDGLVDSIVNFGDDVPEQPTDENSQIVDIVAIITDSTGIVDIVTRPYTGPWPPVDDEDDGAVTLPFAKPGQTFAPGSMVGLGQSGVKLGGSTTQTPPDVDSFQAGDLPQDMETASSSPIASEALLTTAKTTPTSIISTTTGPPETAVESNPPSSPSEAAQLGPLASVPVMDHDQDYIGDVDYDQHLLPALMPIRPGTKAGAVETAGAGSGDSDDDGAADAAQLEQDLMFTSEVVPLPAPASQKDDTEGSGANLTEEQGQSEGNTPFQSDLDGNKSAQQHSPMEGQLPAIQISTENSILPVGSTAISGLPSAEGTTSPASETAANPAANLQQAPVSEDTITTESPTSAVAAELHGSAPPDEADAEGFSSPSHAVSGGPVEESLSDTPGPQQCGRMGSSLASLIARSKYHPRLRAGGSDQEAGGEVTSTVVWCWMAALVRRTHDPANPYSFICSGTLVERDLVLTTAGCASRLFQEPLRNFVVLLGASSLRVNLELGVHHMELEEIIIHEDYTINNDIYANDIGLVKLSSPAVLGRTVCLLCLPPPTMELSGRQSCSVTGYGLSEGVGGVQSADDLAVRGSGVLRQTGMPVIPSRQCSAMSRLKQHHPEVDRRAFLCAGGHRSADACLIAREGGSPLACTSASGRYYLYGLVSYSDGCGADHAPRLFTRVANYFTWIRENYERMTRNFRVRAGRR